MLDWLQGYYADELIKRFFDPENPIFRLGRDENVLRLYQLVLDYVKEAKPGYPQQISALTHQLLGILNFLSEANTNTTLGEQLIADAKFLLRETLQYSCTIESIMKDLPVRYSKFRKDFKRITGESPNQYQLNLLLSKVKELLSTTKLSISEIAYQTGFESVSYLSKIFKKKNNISPSSYRN